METKKKDQKDEKTKKRKKGEKEKEEQGRILGIRCASHLLTEGVPDGPTDGRTYRQTLLQRCEDASKNANVPSNGFEEILSSEARKTEIRTFYGKRNSLMLCFSRCRWKARNAGGRPERSLVS